MKEIGRISLQVYKNQKDYFLSKNPCEKDIVLVLISSTFKIPLNSVTIIVII